MRLQHLQAHRRLTVESALQVCECRSKWTFPSAKNAQKVCGAPHYKPRLCKACGSILNFKGFLACKPEMQA
jgi:hypothetical protein